jgi:hypothetical protein
VWDTLWVLLLTDYVEKVPHCRSITLDLMLSSVSPNIGGWKKAFLVEFFMTSSALGVYSNCLTVPGEETPPVSSSFSLGALGEHMVVGFLDDILPATIT